jgi:hypothetical protein
LPGARHAQATPVVSIRRRCRTRLVVRAGLRRPRHGEVAGGTHEAAILTRLAAQRCGTRRWRRDNESSQVKHSGKATAEAQQASASSTAASYVHKQWRRAANGLQRQQQSKAQQVKAKQSKARHDIVASGQSGQLAWRRSEELSEGDKDRAGESRRQRQ